jgi:hypothetical protein
LLLDDVDSQHTIDQHTIDQKQKNTLLASDSIIEKQEAQEEAEPRSWQEVWRKERRRD